MKLDLSVVTHELPQQCRVRQNLFFSSLVQQPEKPEGVRVHLHVFGRVSAVVYVLCLVCSYLFDALKPSERAY